MSPSELVPPPPLEYGEVTRTDFVRYQGASGDMNPVHHDDAAATRAGQATAFAPGMFAAGVMATWATAWLGLENVRKFGVRFKDQLFPGDELSCGGEVIRQYEHEGERRVDLELTCLTSGGRQIAVGWATFVVPARDT